MEKFKRLRKVHSTLGKLKSILSWEVSEEIHQSDSFGSLQRLSIESIMR